MAYCRLTVEHVFCRVIFQQGCYRLEHDLYSSVPQLVEHLVSSRQPVTRKSGVVLHTVAPRLDWELRNDDIELQIKIGSVCSLFVFLMLMNWHRFILSLLVLLLLDVFARSLSRRLTYESWEHQH